MALDIPTAEELFDAPYPEAPPVPSAWAGDSVAVEMVDRACARLLANCLYEPPIIEEEIDRYAKHFGLTRQHAELEIRRGRNANR